MRTARLLVRNILSLGRFQLCGVSLCGLVLYLFLPKVASNALVLMRMCYKCEESDPRVLYICLSFWSWICCSSGLRCRVLQSDPVLTVAVQLTHMVLAVFPASNACEWFFWILRGWWCFVLVLATGEPPRNGIGGVLWRCRNSVGGYHTIPKASLHWYVGNKISFVHLRVARGCWLY